MDDSAYKKLLACLESSRGSLDSWLTFWTWLVVIGVALELVFAFHAHFDEMAAWRRGITRPPERPSRIWFIFELLAIAVVTVGIAGELVVESSLGNLETKIRTTNDQRFLLLQSAAGDALNSALQAAWAADRAKGVSEKAATEADTAQKGADAVEHELVLSKKEAADARGRLADSLERTARLESQLSWRTVTPEQKAKLRKLLSSTTLLLPLRGLKIDIKYVNQDPEAEEYAVEIGDAMAGLGAEIAEPNGMEFFGTKSLQGVRITANPTRNSRATMLLNVLNNAGLPCMGVESKGLDDRTLSIVVGAKPRNPKP